MLVLRVLAALLAAAFLGFTLGMLKDYFKLFPPERYDFVWPFMCSFCAVAGAVVMAFMKPSRLTALTGKAGGRVVELPAATGKQPAAAVPASSEVPGMPTFDFDQNSSGSTEAADLKEQP